MEQLNTDGTHIEPHQAFSKILSGLTGLENPIQPYFSQPDSVIYNNNCLEILSNLPAASIDMIFADPPYLLSNNGFTCKNGKMATVNKGKWDRSAGLENNLEFHNTWISACRRVLKPEGSLWISGTYHSIYQCGYLIQKNGFHILNDIAWFKPNAAPNLSCRFFTASHETLLWARRNYSAKHTFNYSDMKNGTFPEDKLKKSRTQMRSVWSIPTPGPAEKQYGKHPTQKPLALLNRIVKASTKPGDIILDPFSGTGTSGAAVKNAGSRFYIGIELERQYCEIGRKRLEAAGKPPSA